ncbi:MAG TPA: RloB family protein [Nostocaceae cyanobacterium]|nr:RloB family protein [Nostocaceae cyanobacterium]
MPRERNTNYQDRTTHINHKCKDGKWKLYVIAAEGYKTEANYFKELENQYREKFNSSYIHVEFIDRLESGDSDPNSVYKTIIQFSQILQQQYKLRENYDELWLIIDTDEHDNRRECIINLAQECNTNFLYKLGLSNPCFEIWLMMHFVDLEISLIKDYIPGENTDKSLKDYIEESPIKKRSGICKNLLNRIHNNEHQPYYTKLIEYIPQAITRAKKLGGCNPNNPNYPQEIGTQVYELLEKLMQEVL